MKPPFLLGPVIDRPGVGVKVIGEVGMAVAEVAVSGPWSPQLGEQVTAALRVCLAGPSSSIIIDLHDLADPYGVSLAYWLALWQRARFAAAPVRVTFCVPHAAALSRRLRYLRGPQPRVFTTVPEAHIAIAERISQADRLQVQLAPRPASVEAARTLVSQACHAWHSRELLQDMRLIVSELSGNAVEHACTDLIVTVSRAGTRVYVAVHDCVSHFPCPSGSELASPQASFDERGRGLRLVHAVAAAWGAMPTREGKVVWASMV